MQRTLYMVAVVLTLASCATVPTDLPPAPEVPIPVVTNYTAPNYLIQPGDVLDLRLMLNPELNEEVVVRPDGHISTTVVPDIVAAGRTVPDLNESLRRAYSRDLKQPRLSVLVKSYAASRFYVAGEVNQPGEFIEAGEPLSLSQAIARAGGAKFSGDTTNVVIIRKAANNKPELLSARYSKIEHASDASADVTLAPYDVVFVPRTTIAEVYKWWNQYVEQFAHPSMGFSYLINPGGTSSVIGGGGGTAVVPTATPATR